MNIQDSIVVIEKDKKKAEIAKKLGIRLIVNSIDKKSKLEIIKFFRGKVDLCYDSAGSIKTLEASLDLLKNDGRLHFASHPDEKLKMKIKPYDFILGKRISGSWAGGCSPGRDVNKFSKIINNNKKLINSLLLKEYNLEDINVAIKDFIDGKVFRPIIKMRH